MRWFSGWLILLLAGWTEAADVEVTVKGVSVAKGTLLVGFYNQASTFRNKQLPQSIKTPVTKTGPVTVVARNLPPGVYAVAVIWDLNSNGVLDRKGPFKRPTEPFGFSNNPKLKFRPPEYPECTFTVKEPGGKLEISLLK